MALLSSATWHQKKLSTHYHVSCTLISGFYFLAGDSRRGNKISARPDERCLPLREHTARQRVHTGWNQIKYSRNTAIRFNRSQQLPSFYVSHQIWHLCLLVSWPFMTERYTLTVCGNIRNDDFVREIYWRHNRQQKIQVNCQYLWC